MQGTPYDALFVTALPLERAALLLHFADTNDFTHKGTNVTVGTISTPGGRVLRIALCITGPGNAAAASISARALSLLEPRFAIFVGVAGGRKDLAIGDVVAADKVYGYESGKETEAGLLPRPEAMPGSHSLVQLAMIEASNDVWRRRIPVVLSPTPRPNVIVKPIASGDKLIASSHSDTANRLKNSYGDAVAVDMEAHGFSRAAAQSNGCQFIVVRGISDTLDDKAKASDLADQKRAAAHASAFAVTLLLRAVDALPLPPDSPSAPPTALTFVIDNLTVSLEGSAHAPWLKALCDELAPRIRPTRGGSSDQGSDHGFLLAIEHGSLGNVATRSAGLAPPFSLQLQSSESLHETLLAIVDAATLLIAGNHVHCLERLLGVAEAPDAQPSLRLSLLFIATDLVAPPRYAGATRIAECALQLDELDPDLFQRLLLVLSVWKATAERVGQQEEASRSSQLIATLADRRLRGGGSVHEAMYSLSRNVETDLALRILDELGTLRPDYKLRWYWHRDRALHLYSLQMLDAAGRAYDTARGLRPDYSRLARCAGDCYFYLGEWSEAAVRFEAALGLDGREHFFVTEKLALCQAQLRHRKLSTPLNSLQRRVGRVLERVGAMLCRLGLVYLSMPLLRFAVALEPLSATAAKVLGDHANNNGRYAEAAQWLMVALAGRPENPQRALNITANLIFANHGSWGGAAAKYGEYALFHGGAEALERFRTQLINTPTRDELLATFASMLERVTELRGNWLSDQNRLVGQENLDGTVHVEFVTSP